MRRHLPNCPTPEPEIMSGPQICKVCNTIRSTRYEAFLYVLDLVMKGCSDEDCGCDLRMTDCCEDPRWECETGIIFDGAGDPDVTVCRPDYGCKAWKPEPFFPDPIPDPPF